jgi:hypothetical protein
MVLDGGCGRSTQVTGAPGRPTERTGLGTCKPRSGTQGRMRQDTRLKGS